VDAAAAARRREKLAWQIVLASFAVFILLLGSIPLGVRWYLTTAVSAHPATLEIIRGTVLYVQAGSRQEISAGNRIELGEGDQVRTAPDSQALLSLFDGSNLHLWPEATLRIERMRSSTYNNSTTEIILNQKAGRSRVEVALPSTESRQFEVKTPQASARLREGSYSVQVVDSSMELAVRRGSASVSAAGRTVEVLPGERTIAAASQPPQQPQPAAVNYVANGDFANALASWKASNRNVEDGIPGDISLVEQDGRNIVRFVRRSTSKHAETYIHQNIDQDVADLQSLRLSLQLKVLRQSLSGGGWLGSEYPLTIRLHYRDANGSETTWVHGFYIQNDEGRPTTNGQQVQPDIWLSFAADLFNPNQVYPRPAQVLWLELEASGWEYESMVTGIQLIGE